VGVGVYPDVPAAVESAVRLRQEMRPEAENAPLYRERHQLYKDLYVALKAAFDRAAAWDTES
jgi:sugar (pentulose or hexulose) kinase